MVWNGKAPYRQPLKQDAAPRAGWILRPRRAAICLAWSTLLSIPLWLATLAVVKVVLVPEVRAVAERWSGQEAKSAPPGGLYARMDPHPLLRAGRREAHAVVSDVMRHI